MICLRPNARRNYVILLLSGAIIFLNGSRTDAQDRVEKRDFRATTLDGVRLVGDFYPPQGTSSGNLPKGRNAPCVLLLHGMPGGGVKGNRQDWGNFPAQLARKGFAVLAFDFRGHGESVEVEREYWIMNPTRNRRGNLTRLSPKDFRRAVDYLKMGNDIMEAKLYLNQVSEAGTCNSNNIVIIGAEEGAVLGLLWAAHGFTSPAVERIDPTRRSPGGKLWEGPRSRIDKRLEGEDLSAVIWLSLREPALGNQNVLRVVLPALSILADKRVASLVLYGEQDRAAQRFWRSNFSRIKPRGARKEYETTALKRIEKTKLSGTKLLGNPAFNTEELIFEYLAKDRVIKDQVHLKKSDIELQQSLFAIQRLLR